MDCLQIWHIDLERPDIAIHDCEKILDTEEKAKAARFTFLITRQRYVIAHAALRSILGKHLGCAPQTLVFAKNAQGKPYLPQHKLHFNFSHSASRALLAISTRFPIGIDIEKISIQKHLMRFVQRHFSLHEQAIFHTLAPKKQHASFYRWWTLKEACLKAGGMGLHFPLSKFSIDFHPEKSPQVLEGPQIIKKLQLFYFSTEEYAAALAINTARRVKIPGFQEWTGVF